jgi:uncharacterized protein (DUF433 family)
MTLVDGITSDPAVLHGQPVVAGTRIPVTVVLDNLAGGVTEAQLLAEYPSLTIAGIRAALAYAAALAHEDVVAV